MVPIAFGIVASSVHLQTSGFNLLWCPLLMISLASCGFQMRPMVAGHLDPRFYGWPPSHGPLVSGSTPNVLMVVVVRKKYRVVESGNSP